MKKKHHKLQLGKKILMCILVASMVLGNVGCRAGGVLPLEPIHRKRRMPLAQEENTETSEDEVNSADETVDVVRKRTGSLRRHRIRKRYLRKQKIQALPRKRKTR